MRGNEQERYIQNSNLLLLELILFLSTSTMSGVCCCGSVHRKGNTHKFTDHFSKLEIMLKYFSMHAAIENRNL